MLKTPESMRECFPHYNKAQNTPKLNYNKKLIGWQTESVFIGRLYNWLNHIPGDLILSVLILPCVNIYVNILLQQKKYNEVKKGKV